MKSSRFFATLLIICAFAVEAFAQSDESKAIEPYAYNMARIIQDFTQSHAKNHQRPDKFCVIPVGNGEASLLWVSTFDEGYGCLFSCARGINKLLDVGYNAAGEHVDLAMRNGVMIVTSSNNAGEIVGAQFYRFNGGELQELDFTMKNVDGREVYLDAKGKELKLNKVQKELDKGLKKNQEAVVYNSETMEWKPFRKIGTYLNASEDITLSQLPILAYADYKRNEFTTHAQMMLDAASYRHIVFKDKVGEASLKSGGGGTSVYSLNDANAIKKMFRGYKDSELFPIIATDDYLATHEMKSFVRWKYPERIKPMEKERQQIVSNYFGGRAIKNARWIADLESSDRKLYAVEFKPEGNQALAVIACFIGNNLVSTYDQYAVVDKSRGWLWTPGDKGDFMNALPELQGLAMTDEGFELYMSQMVGEKRHMIVVREVRSMFIEIIEQIF